jgi:hypothetical protein
VIERLSSSSRGLGSDNSETLRNGGPILREESDEADASLKRLAKIVVATSLLAAPATAEAASQLTGTIKVGAFTKRAIGTVKSITAGDVACYYELEDAKGSSFTELADFALCEARDKRLYQGKKVYLTYGVEKVIADDCEGNPACARHKDAAAIKKVRLFQ